MSQSINFSIGIVSLLLFMPSIALAQAVSPTAPPSETTLPLNRSTVPSSPPIESAPNSVAQESIEEIPLSCPTGQFASKFSDVTPEDWAYEAVNRLASGQFRCFSRSSQS